MEQLLGDIAAGGWPAPAPIEQRWSAGSASTMSPAAGPKVTSWVGIIMYLPDENPAARAAITARCGSQKGFGELQQGFCILGALVTGFCEESGVDGQEAAS